MGFNEQEEWRNDYEKREKKIKDFDNEQELRHQERIAAKQAKEEDERLRKIPRSVGTGGGTYKSPYEGFGASTPVGRFFAWAGGLLLFIIGMIWYFEFELPNILGFSGSGFLTGICVFCLLLGFAPGLVYILIIFAAVIYIYWDIAFPTGIDPRHISFHSFIGVAVIIATVTSFKRYFVPESYK